jgi:transposase
MDYRVITNPENPLCGKSYEEVLEMVKKDGCVLRYVKKQTPELCLAAVKQNGWIIQHIKEQTLEICLAAVQQNRWALQFVWDEFYEEVKASL